MFTKKTVEDIDVKGKVALVRVDFNVPLKNGLVMDGYRIKQALPTIKYLISHDAKVVLISHLGRPEGKNAMQFSLKPVAAVLERMLGVKVTFVRDCIGKPVQDAVTKMKPGKVLLLENLRFHAEEEKDDEAFAKALAKPAELFVQDGFGVVHRKHASTDSITRYLPSVAGFLLKKEVDTITSVMAAPKRPLMAIIGGAKIADKLDLIKRFCGAVFWQTSVFGGKLIICLDWCRGLDSILIGSYLRRRVWRSYVFFFISIGLGFYICFLITIKGHNLNCFRLVNHRGVLFGHRIFTVALLD